MSPPAERSESAAAWACAAGVSGIAQKGVGAASAVWNAGFDVGTATGDVVDGVGKTVGGLLKP